MTKLDRSKTICSLGFWRAGLRALDRVFLGRLSAMTGIGHPFGGPALLEQTRPVE